MIKESQIGNFVSLIKILKKQKKPCKPQPVANSNDQQKRNISLRISNHSKKLISYEKNFSVHKTQNVSNETDFMELKIELKTQARRKKKLYRNYCQQIQKRKSTQFQNFSLRRFPQFLCDGVSSIKYSRLSHKRSSTGNMMAQNFLKNQSKKRVNKIQNEKQLRMRMFRKTNKQNRLNQNICLENNQNKTWNQPVYNKMRVSNAKNQRLPLQILKQNTLTNNKLRQKVSSEMRTASKEAWIIDPWQQNLDSKQLICQQED